MHQDPSRLFQTETLVIHAWQVSFLEKVQRHVLYVPRVHSQRHLVPQNVTNALPASTAQEGLLLNPVNKALSLALELLSAAIVQKEGLLRVVAENVVCASTDLSAGAASLPYRVEKGTTV